MPVICESFAVAVTVYDVSGGFAPEASTEPSACTRSIAPLVAVASCGVSGVQTV